MISIVISVVDFQAGAPLRSITLGGQSPSSNQILILIFFSSRENSELQILIRHQKQ